MKIIPDTWLRVVRTKFDIHALFLFLRHIQDRQYQLRSPMSEEGED
jgi:hypothetical protein